MSRPSFVLATVGGSITTGYAAPEPPRNGWAALVAQGLAPRYPQGFEWRNRGVSGTDSVAAAVRLEDHVGDADLVLLEFAVNDLWLHPTVRLSSWEGCLRQLLKRDRPPRVLVVLLCDREGRSVADEQKRVCDYYGIDAVDLRPWRRDDLWDEDPIHPNGRGHRVIADLVLAALANPAQVPTRRPPLFGDDWAHPWIGDRTSLPWVGEGWRPSLDVHPEWKAHGGAPRGWFTTDEDAELVLTVDAPVVGLWYSESDGYRNLEAWLEGSPEWVTLGGYQASRRGYLGWAFQPLGLARVGASTIHVRLKNDEWAGSGRPGHLVAVITAGARSPEVVRTEVEALGSPDPGALSVEGRFDPQDLPGLRFDWGTTRLRGRLEGNRLAMRWDQASGRNLLRVSLDGSRREFFLPEGSSQWVVDLGGDHRTGAHEVEMVKLSEGYFGTAVLTGLEGTWVPSEAPLGRWIDFYGDSITAGACNLDLGVDQYEDLATHDPALAYPALTARLLGAQARVFAVSGTGLTASWNPILLPEVWFRTAPRPEASPVESSPAPHIVVVNVGQNDWGYPASQGLPLSSEYGFHLEAFVRALRSAHPGSWIVVTLGGMTAPLESNELRDQWNGAISRLNDDQRVRSLVFVEATTNHPRVPNHARMADQLASFLRPLVDETP